MPRLINSRSAIRDLWPSSLKLNASSRRRKTSNWPAPSLTTTAFWSRPWWPKDPATAASLASLTALAAAGRGPITTEIAAAPPFYYAEDLSDDRFSACGLPSASCAADAGGQRPVPAQCH
ncbi:hypothetical protein WCLP8_1740005 [uncultured Gammaproteobacteria bacterium]